MYERDRCFAVAHFTCGHKAEYRTSPPKQGDMVICWNCAKLTMVDRLEKNVKRVYRPSANDWEENA